MTIGQNVHMLMLVGKLDGLSIRFQQISRLVVYNIAASRGCKWGLDSVNFVTYVFVRICFTFLIIDNLCSIHRGSSRWTTMGFPTPMSSCTYCQEPARWIHELIISLCSTFWLSMTASLLLSWRSCTALPNESVVCNVSTCALDLL